MTRRLPLVLLGLLVLSAGGAVSGSDQTSPSLSEPLELPDRPQNVPPSPAGGGLACVQNGELQLRDPTMRLERTLITRTGPESKVVISVRGSADGRHLLYLYAESRYGAEAELFSMDVASGQSRLIAPKGNYLRIAGWSADGRDVLLNVGDVTLLSSEGNGVAILRLETGALRAVPGLEQAWDVSFSPDARSIVYDRDVPGVGTGDIYVVAVDGSDHRPLVASPFDEHVLGWTADGNLLYSSDVSGTDDVWMARVSEGRVVGEPRLLLRDTGKLDWVTTTTGGDFYYRTASKDHVFTVTLDAATSKVTSTPKRALVTSGGGLRAPAWSPDGRQLALKGNLNDLRIHTLSDGHTRQMRPELPGMSDGQESSLGWLTWSADGQSILTDGDVSPAGPLPKGAYSVNIANGEVTVLVDKPPRTVTVNQVKWLPDGRSVVYLESFKAIVIRDLETGEERRLYDSSDNTRIALDSLALSPDGRMVAFREKAHMSVMTMDVAGSTPSRVLTKIQGPWPGDLSGTARITWSADGRYVIYSDTADQVDDELWRVAVSGGQPERLGLRVNRRVTDLAMQPGGAMLAFVMADGQNKPRGYYVSRRLVAAASLAAASTR